METIKARTRLLSQDRRSTEWEVLDENGRAVGMVQREAHEGAPWMCWKYRRPHDEPGAGAGTEVGLGATTEGLRAAARAVVLGKRF